MKIPNLQKYPRRRSPGSYFYDLPPEARERARAWFNKFVSRRRAQGKPLPPWLRAIYVGQARRLALNPPTSSWGRSMRARKGGLAVQARYRAEGRDPLEMANIVKDRKRRSKVRVEEEDTGYLPSEGPSMTAISLSGKVDPGMTAQRTADKIQEEIQEALGQAFSRDTRFGEHLACPKENWLWEIRLTPFSNGLPVAGIGSRART
jgi:hypothetical protein